MASLLKWKSLWRPGSLISSKGELLPIRAFKIWTLHHTYQFLASLHALAIVVQSPEKCEFNWIDGSRGVIFWFKRWTRRNALLSQLYTQPLGHSASSSNILPAFVLVQSCRSSGYDDYWNHVLNLRPRRTWTCRGCNLSLNIERPELLFRVDGICNTLIGQGSVTSSIDIWRFGLD